MQAILRRLWHGDDGFVVSTELILLATILVLGLVAGLSQVAATVNVELGDLAQAISFLNQGFSFAGVSGHHGVSGGSFSFDFPDTHDGTNCIAVCMFNDPLPGS